MAAMTAVEHKGVCVLAGIDVDAGTVTLVCGFPSPASKRAASPQVIPIGAIESLDVKLGGLRAGYVRLVLRNGGNAPKVTDDLYAFVPNVRTIEPWLEALRLAVAEAVPVYDFAPPPPPMKSSLPTPPPRPTAGSRPKKKRPGWMKLLESFESGEG